MRAVCSLLIVANAVFGTSHLKLRASLSRIVNSSERFTFKVRIVPFEALDFFVFMCVKDIFPLINK